MARTLALSTLACLVALVVGVTWSDAPLAQTAAKSKGLGKALAKGSLTTIYECWFQSPYEYMFTTGAPGSPMNVSVNGKDFGVFDAGIKGIMLYGSLAECMGKQVGTASSGFYDLQGVAALAGLPLHGPKHKQGGLFDYYNEELVQWGMDNLVPDPSTTIGGAKAQVIYNVVFARFFRMMAETYCSLHADYLLTKEKDDYLAAVKAGKAGLDYLMDRFQSSSLAHYGTKWDGTAMTVQMAYGFWLRRSEDGTMDELWAGLKKLLGQYDRQVYADMKSKYATKGIKW